MSPFLNKVVVVFDDDNDDDDDYYLNFGLRLHKILSCWTMLHPLSEGC